MWAVLVAGLGVIFAVAAALGGFYTGKRGRHDIEVTESLAALDVMNRNLREELIRVTTHRDQLLAEQAALLKKMLLNGNGHDKPH